MSKSFRLGVAGLLVAGVLALSPVAFAAHGAPAKAQAPAGVTSGKCSISSTWLLTLKYDAGKIESDFELNTPRAGQSWAITMKDNGVKFWGGNRTTLADGSLSVSRLGPNNPGKDSIVITAKNAVTGESCKATGSL